VPVLMFGPTLRSRTFGIADSFAHIGETVARHLGIGAGPHGRSLI
jgi:phosphopentomutase